MEVNNLDFIPDGLIGKVIPKTSYAVFKVPLKNVLSGDFWQYFYKKWLHESGYEQPGSLVTQNGYQITSKAQIEIYNNVTCAKEEEMEIYAPIILYNH